MASPGTPQVQPTRVQNPRVISQYVQKPGDTLPDDVTIAQLEHAATIISGQPSPADDLHFATISFTNQENVDLSIDTPASHPHNMGTPPGSGDSMVNPNSKGWRTACP